MQPVVRNQLALPTTQKLQLFTHTTNISRGEQGGTRLLPKPYGTPMHASASGMLQP
jgi:hypothetical protein